MARRRQNLKGGDGRTLKVIRGTTVVLECSLCDRRHSFERKVLVAQFGARACLAKLRRRKAIGCERMVGPEGDRCQTRFQFLVFEASSADEAIEAIERNPHIRLVFTDIDMLGTMNGLRLARFVRDRWPRLKS